MRSFGDNARAAGSLGPVVGQGELGMGERKRIIVATARHSRLAKEAGTPEPKGKRVGSCDTVAHDGIQ